MVRTRSTGVAFIRGRSQGRGIRLIPHGSSHPHYPLLRHILRLLAPRVESEYPYGRWSIDMQQLELRLRTMTNKLRRLRFWVLAVSATGLLCGGAWCVAAAPVSSENASNTVAAAAAGTNVAAIPLVEVAPQA